MNREEKLKPKPLSREERLEKVVQENMLEKLVQEDSYAQKLLDTPLREVYERIKKMIGKPLWDQRFVAKFLLGFEQCLKVLDADYETIDLLTGYYHLLLPKVEESKREVEAD